MVNFGGVLGLLGAQRGMAGVADASHGREYGSMMQKWGIWGQILGCHDQTLPLLPNFAAKYVYQHRFFSP